MNTDADSRKWLDSLDDEDLAFLKRFLLASGSLKEMAKIYDVSYPTVRLRTDRLIQKVKIHDETDGDNPFEASLRSMAAEGKFDTVTLKALLLNYRQTNQKFTTEPEMKGGTKANSKEKSRPAKNKPVSA